MMIYNSYFLHGLDSSGKGTKGQFFARRFPQVRCPDFQGTLSNRLQQLDELCKSQQQLLFIGSSFGGLMASCFAAEHPEKVARLILLSPALNFESYRPPTIPLQVPTLLVIGKHDTITPAADVIPLAEATFADLETRMVDDDHLLHQSFFLLDWTGLLHKTERP